MTWCVEGSLLLAFAKGSGSVGIGDSGIPVLLLVPRSSRGWLLVCVCKKRLRFDYRIGKAWEILMYHAPSKNTENIARYLLSKIPGNFETEEVKKYSSGY